MFPAEIKQLITLQLQGLYDADLLRQKAHEICQDLKKMVLLAEPPPLYCQQSCWASRLKKRYDGIWTRYADEAELMQWK